MARFPGPGILGL